ncbi:esterase family protein [Gordonia sp. GONU]|nr:esterase family protein [Gordonia sp. GONU]
MAMGDAVGLSIIGGWIPLTVTVLGVVAVLWLILSPRKRHLFVVVPVTIAVTVVLALLVRRFIEHSWGESVPVAVCAWGAAGVLGLLLSVPRLVAGRGVVQRSVTVLAAVLAVVLGLSHVNTFYAWYPTVGALIHDEGAPTVSVAQVAHHQRVVDLPEWRPSRDIGRHGRILTAGIPGSVSGFRARPAKVYLPPAVFDPVSPRLPVLVLLAGQPGSPEDWLFGGRLAATMDSYASAHDGLAPIVILADGTGSIFGNPLCLDSRLGRVATYLTDDVASWARRTLPVAETDRRAWAIGGLSYGGTCALQLATTRPGMYPTFLDLSGDAEPSLGSTKTTVDAAFGGDAAAFRAVTPLHLLASRRYPESAGAFVVGRGDRSTRPAVVTSYRAARAAGMDVHYSEVPGGHTFTAWAVALRQQTPWLAQRLGLGPPGQPTHGPVVRRNRPERIEYGTLPNKEALRGSAPSYG